jgi:hypothetical protein
MQENTSLVAFSERWSVHHGRARIRRLFKRLRRSEYSSLLSGRRRKAGDPWDRRSYERFCLKVGFYVTPVAFDGEAVEVLDASSSAVPAMTRDLTIRGVGFTHQQLLFGDYAVVECPFLDCENVALLLAFRWSNIRNDGCYMSGGRFEALLHAEG